MIRLVIFDAFGTILAPRLPVYVQYSQTFAPYLGVLDPDALKSAFRVALKQLQVEKPVYENGAEGWWGEVIKRTAVGAGADPQTVDKSLPEIVPKLMKRFSSREGYKAFDDSLPTLEKLRAMGVKSALVSNADSRMRLVLDDLSLSPHLTEILISEEEGIEKPAKEIFARACQRVGVGLDEAVHVGDELDGDYYGASKAGLQALLVRRPGPEGDDERKEEGENLCGVTVVHSLLEVADWVQQKNSGKK
ncbi:hypothetical protein GLOTRDRAFT_38464 [Gloeophyllum trabeum ATCC 11539]|uniref:HAD hydrolase subfamily IA REG-2-like protein n=1 Tax=Gloeophyllum trabeum (strain ATCC 11539 / FP-39264 / Madison 617) TaxID=670483 RepID=S7RWI7_GLOTA|nr:uncharacterized protein GLOTRDRAFT_38464 [Gloeophyllum trabeum ATCC 11539]EPQ57694.1 hypothetical protein GLOTRDRAFT_38464 [Gloeophyllum trabeum ATCC 11539]